MQVILCGGGTGGHLFAAIATARSLCDLNPNIEVILATDKIVEKEKAFRSLFFVIPRRSPRWKWPFFLWGMVKAFLKALWIFLRKRPALVVGFGGYTTFPIVFAAQLLRIHTLLHEQNAYLGLVNRFLLKRAKMLALSFKDTLAVKGKTPVIVTGNPVRFSSQKEYQGPSFPLNIFMLGGSQGASIFSKVVPEAFGFLSDEERGQFRLVMQCREELLKETKAAFSQLHMAPILAPFFKNVFELYEVCDVVIARSGASTVGEVVTMGRAALFIPYPLATDDHQYHNAKALGDACFLVRNHDFTAEFLANFLKSLLKDPSILKEKAKAASFFSMADASGNLARTIQSLLPTM